MLSVYLAQPVTLSKTSLNAAIIIKTILALKKKKKCVSRSVLYNSLRPHGPVTHQAPMSMEFSRQEH